MEPVKGKRKASDWEEELEAICKSCGQRRLDSHGMTEDSQVKGKYFSSMTLENEVVIKSFREDDFRLSTKRTESEDTIFVVVLQQTFTIHLCILGLSLNKACEEQL